MARLGRPQTAKLHRGDGGLVLWARWIRAGVLRGISRTAGLVGTVLAAHVNAQGTAFPAAGTIAGLTGAKRQTVYRALAELRARGVIVPTGRVKRRNANALGPVSYRFVEPPDPMCTPQGDISGTGTSELSRCTPQGSIPSTPQGERGSTPQGYGGSTPQGVTELHPELHPERHPEGRWGRSALSEPLEPAGVRKDRDLAAEVQFVAGRLVDGRLEAASRSLLVTLGRTDSEIEELLALATGEGAGGNGHGAEVVP